MIMQTGRGSTGNQQRDLVIQLAGNPVREQLNGGRVILEGASASTAHAPNKLIEDPICHCCHFFKRVGVQPLC